MASDAKAYFSSKVEHSGKTVKAKNGKFADVYGSSAPSYAQVEFWVGYSNAVERL